MAIRIDLRLPSRLPDKRVVLRDVAIVADAQNLADVRTWLLRLHRSIAIAKADEEQSVLVPREPRAVTAAGRPNRAACRDPRVVVSASTPAARGVRVG